MADPLLIFRVGYMSAYDGAGEISGGGSHVEEHGEGGEMWNFRLEGGRHYGYVMTRHFAGIDLGRIVPKSRWEASDELDGVDVVFVAKRPGYGQVVVGWYKGATVFHKTYRKRRGNRRLGDWDRLDYLCEAEADNAVLLPEGQRTFRVPYAPVDGKGYPGHSNVWYAHSETAGAADLVRRLRKYIASPSAAPRKKIGWPAAPDKDLIIKIESAAVDATIKHYEAEGYDVRSVETDNRGWDLEATGNGETLLIEVKGHFGNVIQFELTPNEYAQLQANSRTYRVCVVRNALQEGPEVEVYVPSEKGGTWTLDRDNGEGRIQFSERIAARAFEAA